MNYAPGAGSIDRPVDHAAVQRATTVPRTPLMYLQTLNMCQDIISPIHVMADNNETSERTMTNLHVYIHYTL